MDMGLASRLFHLQSSGIWVGEGGDADTGDVPLPKPKRKKREGKPAAPTPLADEDTVATDPKAK